MQRVFLLFGLLVFDASSATAYDLILSGDECSSFVSHRSDADGDVSYKAGVDVDGKKVESADLNDNAIEVPQSITIPISLRLAPDASPASPPPNPLYTIGRFDNQAKLGDIKYDIKTGELYFDGKKLSQDDQNAIIDACKKHADDNKQKK